MPRSAGAAIAAASLVAIAPAGAQTVAGTRIVNVAALHADGSGGVAASNPVTLVAAERLDCTLARTDAVGGDLAALLLTNTGTGQEAFAIAATGSDGGARSVSIDADGDGRLDPARDRLLADGTTPQLAPGASLRLLVAVENDASLAVAVRATTGSGAPGTSFAARGDGGGDAVVGATGGEAHLLVPLAEVPPTVVETQAVVADDGGTAVRRGSVVTYTIVARFVSPTSSASLIDPIPAGTAYLPASLILDGAAVADAGRVADGRVAVPLGVVAAGAVHRLVFKIVIQ